MYFPLKSLSQLAARKTQGMSENASTISDSVMGQDCVQITAKQEATFIKKMMDLHHTISFKTKMEKQKEIEVRILRARIRSAFVF
jgi:hypothetical protein